MDVVLGQLGDGLWAPGESQSSCLPTWILFSWSLLSQLLHEFRRTLDPEPFIHNFL